MGGRNTEYRYNAKPLNVARNFMKTLIASIIICFIIFSCRTPGWKKEASKKYLGMYKLETLDCKQCDSCEINLLSDYTYNIVKDGRFVRKGKWDIGTAFDIPGDFLELENGPTNVIFNTPRQIEYITTLDCCVLGCEENIAAEFNGKIVKIDSNQSYYGQGTIFIKTKSGDTIKYYPKYFAHPWIKDTIKIGDYISKVKNTMSFTIMKSKGDTIVLNYKLPNCEEACDILKLAKDLKDSLDRTRK